MPLPHDLVTRYVALWNEPDPQTRRTAIEALWTADGGQVLQPPEDLRAGAAALGFADAVLEARGHAALQTRVQRAYEEFVAPGTYRFQERDDALRLQDVVKFHWEMVATAGGEVAAVGLEVLLLAPDGRIRDDYQFIEA